MNTPGYPVRLQFLFSQGGALLLTEISGRKVFVPFDAKAARSFVEKGEADEIAAPGASCGCKHAAPPAPNRAGRIAAVGIVVGEPLLAVAEGVEDRVACCGEECAGELQEGQPRSLRFDRYAVAEDGGYELRDSVTEELPENLVNTFAQRGPSCLPWVRISRDPNRFRACLAKARAIGPMDDASAVYKLVGEHLAKEDQEVFLVILLDSQLHVRAISEIARGSRDRTAVSIPDALRVALVDGAMSMIVVHNHPSGEVRPSSSDEQLTAALKIACQKVGLQLMDHVIVGAGRRRYYSFAAERNKALS
jgi:DNA repair protein RadC